MVNYNEGLSRRIDVFLSSLAQDFIEETQGGHDAAVLHVIPEFSSSGLH